MNTYVGFQALAQGLALLAEERKKMSPEAEDSGRGTSHLQLSLGLTEKQKQ